MPRKQRYETLSDAASGNQGDAYETGLNGPASCMELMWFIEAIAK